MKPKADIDATITEFDRLKAKGEPINLTELTEHHGVERSTLSRRVHRVTYSYEEYISEEC